MGPYAVGFSKICRQAYGKSFWFLTKHTFVLGALLMGGGVLPLEAKKLDVIEQDIQEKLAGTQKTPSTVPTSKAVIQVVVRRPPMRESASLERVKNNQDHRARPPHRLSKKDFQKITSGAGAGTFHGGTFQGISSVNTVNSGPVPLPSRTKRMLKRIPLPSPFKEGQEKHEEEPTEEIQDDEGAN